MVPGIYASKSAMTDFLPKTGTKSGWEEFEILFL